jgi:nitrogen fixation NifU-like protein
MNVNEAMKITRNDVADELDGLPPKKMHCSNLAADALHEAIKDYKRKRGEKVEGNSPSKDSCGDECHQCAVPEKDSKK